mmetsp:Transcript_41056/g.41938  ORF Transcript_41056/g.41938 Transcript_41056/m.41938 type:complete len:155 (-) Transcript_41056:170-634(-)|eukprot:CAMPEP_0182416678 /NCGR_PEP_ID=MMETSP1167-20130531/1053_1 /TAXON_ID=2988 /ORGANISM="Mallomonas Sp, Strain CCMP3275" /LENGTH=154 /DNA_ID=CAMNT_0024589677 /DNA_START=46 /DNA_END=510 /DNA_ORIENTATION=-
MSPIRIIAKAITSSAPVISRRINVGAVRAMSIKYAESHEYIKMSGDIGTVGISDHAAAALGDVVFAELPAVGSKYSAGDSFGSVESVKAASDVYLPVGGEVVETNELLEQNPGTVNESPFDEGWFVKIKVENQAELDNLMDEEAYKKFLDTLEH